MSSNKFELKDKEYKSVKCQMNGFYLVSFRAEKISGALSFIDNILSFEDIANRQIYVDLIIEYNKQIVDDLNIELPKLKIEIKEIQNKILQIEKEVIALQLLLSENESTIDIKQVATNDKLESKLLELKKMKQLYDDYLAIEEQIEQNLSFIKEYLSL